MRLALNGATVMRAPLERDVALAQACGYDAIELWAGKLDAYLRGHTLDDLAADLRGRGVAPWTINSIEDIAFRDAGGRRDVLARLDELCGVARAIGAPAIVVVPGRGPESADRAACIDESVRVLREMADTAGEIALAFEFLGKRECHVPTLDMAIEIVERADRANVGLVLDTFHFHAGGSRLEDIARLPAEKLIVVHINGCEPLPREQLTDAHRLYPGEGAIPIDEILRALRERGFDGVASVEIFRPEYWAQEPESVARTAAAKARDVLARAGFAAGVRA